MEFLNTFQNGMHKDNSVILQPDGTYRDCRNFQLINQDGNNYVIKDALGNRLIFTLPLAYNATIASFQTAPMPIGFVSFPDRLIVFHTNSESSSGGYGAIGELYLTNIGESVAADPQVITVGANTWTFDGYVPLYVHEELNFSKMYKIEGFSFPENDDIGRMYWTDNFNEPRVLDTLNPIFTTYFATGGLVVGDQYMVISGAVTHNGVNYGLGLSATNVFTAVNANFTVANGQALVIRYFPYQLLDWTPSRALGTIRFDRYDTGSKKCGSHQYFYRLGRVSDGYFTSWSYGSAPIHVGVQNTASVLSGNTYHDFVGDGSLTGTPVVSDKSIKVFIENIDTNFDVLQLACAEYDQTYTVPYFISIVEEISITGTTATVEDTGSKNLGELTTNDITLFPASILKCKTITTNKNYNIIGNITERSQALADLSNLTMTSFEYPMVVHGADGGEAGASCANGYVYQNTLVTAQLTNNPGVGEIRPFTRWLVTFGNNTTDTVTYNAVQYTTGQVIVGIVGQTTITFTGLGAVRPCVVKNKYTTTGGVARPNAVQLKTGFWDYKDPAVASEVKGYWSHEKYRWAILCFDKKGNPFYAQYMNDYDMPLISAKGGLMRVDAFGAENSWSLNPSLMRFSGIRFTQEVVDQISGFSIVRAPRDARIITQGLVFQNGQVTSGGITQIYPNDYILNDYVAGITPEFYSYICPDDLVEIPHKRTIGVAGDKMEEACWISPITWNAAIPPFGVYYRSGNSNYDTFAKLFIPTTDASSGNNLRIVTIKSNGWIRLAENATVTNVFSVSNTDYLNGFIQGQSGAGQIDTTCTGAAAVVSNFGRRSIGGEKIIFYADTFKHYNQYLGGYNYTATGQVNPTKILMNYVKELPSPYGGTGDTAKANTLYISTGHFQPITASVLADTETAPGSGIYEFNNVEVGGGDCFTSLVDYGYGLQATIFNATVGTTSIGLYFPCECNSNYGLRRGRKISNSAMGTTGAITDGVSWSPVFLEDYSYNPGYSSEGINFQYPALPVNFLDTTRFPTRARFAGQKVIGEIIDSFRVFLVNDYKDVDVQLGEINNVRSKGDYVYYWQNHAVGSMPILERQLVSGTAGATTSLGTGGVLNRFDTMSTKYGNQHQHGLTDTEFGWIWFDMRNKDVCVMGFGGAVQEITVPTGMKSYFSEIFLERLTSLYSDTYLNSQTYALSSDRPLLGTGIIGVYDPKLKVSYLTFKFRSYFNNGASPPAVADYQILNKDFTVGFSHVNNRFVGFYDKTPAIWHNHNQSVLSANNPKNLNVYYAADMPVPTPVAVGNIIRDGVKEYICTTAGTVAAYASPPSGALFTLINTTNEIYIENEEKAYVSTVLGYEYNKYYGRVVNNSIEFVVNPKAGAMSVEYYEMGATGDNITDIQIDADNGQTATESNIQSWNRDYKYTDGSWWGNYPLYLLNRVGFGGRITDKYLKVKFTKKNYVTNPTTEAGLRTVIQYIRNFFQLKK
jgi:hypothetical protein